MTEKDLARLHRLIAGTILGSLRRWKDRTVNVLKAAAPVGATGHLRSSITGVVSGAFPSFNVRLEAPTATATFTEHGTKPHGINPRFKRGLRWAGKSGTVRIFPQYTRAGRSGGRVWTGRWVVMKSKTVKGEGKRARRQGAKVSPIFESSGRSGGQRGTGKSLVEQRFITKPRQFAVWHPGTDAQRWFGPRVKAAAKALPGEIRADIAKVIRGL